MSKKNIWVAAGDGDLARVTELVETHSQSPNLPDNFTYTPMHAAASYGHIHVLQYLMSKGGNVNVTDGDGDTPLYTVEDVETARFLIEHGAIVQHTNNEGISPIEHLREEFPQVAAYLESADSSSSPASDAVPASMSQYSQNAMSEHLTSDLMVQIQTLAQQQGSNEMNEEAVRRVVTSSVLQSLAQGQALHQEQKVEEEAGEKRTRLE